MYNGINNFNPYGQIFPQNNNFNNSCFIPQQQVVPVDGETGARAVPLGANSSVWLLDSSGLMAWLVTTDNAGNKNAYPYDINPHKTATAPDYDEMNTRISKIETELEALINELTGNPTTTTKQQSTTGNTKSSVNK